MPETTHREGSPTGELQALDAAAQAAAERIEPERPARRSSPTAIIVVLLLAAFAAILNETVLSVALPQLMTDFGVGATTIQWLTTGFLLTMAIVIPTTGMLISRFTTRRLFIAALILFLVGTALAAVAPSFGVMMVARVVQAGGTAIILPLLMTMTLIVVPVQHRGTVMGLNAVVISVAPALGPTLSGFIMGAWGWRWIFGVLLAVGLIAFVVGLLVLRTDGQTRRAPLDLVSVLLSVVAFGGLVYGLSALSALVASGDPVPLLALALGLIGLALFVRRQRSLAATGAPLLDLRPFARHNFRVSVLVVMAGMATMLGTVMVIPMFTQNVLGLSVVTTGLILLPGGLIQGLVSPLFGRVYDRYGVRPVVIPGAVLLAGGQWLLASMSESTSVSALIAYHVVFCVGMALIMTALMTHSLSSLPRELYSHGSAILNTLQQLAGAFGTALLITGLTIGAGLSASAGASAQTAQADGTHWAFVIGGVIGTAGLVLAFFVRPLEARSEAAAEA